MAKKNRLIKCFVAMAFEKEDCDLLYKTQMNPTLKGLGLDVIKVDTREHKDDLNVFIIRMLESSDIAVADLTYARPSVYYEAGFAERQIPIVYTARKDHLSRSQTDDRLRVHFDLEMKKIISWATPQDPTFSKRLRTRVNYFLGPIRRKIQEEKQIESDRQKFAALSVTDRCAEILSKFTARMHAKRFSIRHLSEFYPLNRTDLILASGFFGIKLIGKTCFSSVVVAAESLMKRQIEQIVNTLSGGRLISYGETKDIEEFRDYYFMCSLRKIPVTRLTSAFPNARPSQIPGRYTLLTRNPHLKVDRQVTMYLISPIDSFATALAVAKGATDELPQEKTNKYTSLFAEDQWDWPRISFKRSKSSS